MPIQSWSQNIRLVTLGDEPQFSEDLRQLIEDGQRSKPLPHVVLDFSSVAHITSSNLSQLLRLRVVMREGGARLTLAKPSDAIWAVFLTTGLDKMFAFAQDVPTALASLQMGDQANPDERK